MAMIDLLTLERLKNLGTVGAAPTLGIRPNKKQGAPFTWSPDTNSVHVIHETRQLVPEKRGVSGTAGPGTSINSHHYRFLMLRSTKDRVIILLRRQAFSMIMAPQNSQDLFAKYGGQIMLPLRKY